MAPKGGRLNLWRAPRRDRSVPQIFTVASFGVFIFGRIQPFSGHKALFLMGFLPFCVKPLAPLALEAVGTVGTVGTSNGKPVRARLSKGLCCSHSQFTKWEQWEHFQPFGPCPARFGADPSHPPVLPLMQASAFKPLDAPAPVHASWPRRLNSDGRVWKPE